MAIAWEQLVIIQIPLGLFHSKIKKTCMHKPERELCQPYGTNQVQLRPSWKYYLMCLGVIRIWICQSCKLLKERLYPTCFSWFSCEVMCTFPSDWLYFCYFDMICLSQGLSDYWLLQKDSFMCGYFSTPLSWCTLDWLFCSFPLLWLFLPKGFVNW